MTNKPASEASRYYGTDMPRSTGPHPDPSEAPSPAPEPVAWRSRLVNDPSQKWIYQDQPIKNHSEYWQVEPLYAEQPAMDSTTPFDIYTDAIAAVPQSLPAAPVAPDEAGKHMTMDTIEADFKKWRATQTVTSYPTNLEIYGQGYVAGWNAKEEAGKLNLPNPAEVEAIIRDQLIVHSRNDTIISIKIYIEDLPKIVRAILSRIDGAALPLANSDGGK